MTSLRAIAAAALIILASCKPSEAEVLERNYREAVEKWKMPEDCAQERKIADAWAREGNQKKYDEAKASADTQCMYENALRR